MKERKRIVWLIGIFVGIFCIRSAAFVPEKLNRGLVAVKTEGGVFVSWRLFSTDDDSTSFDLYRDGVKVNSQPIVLTNYFDAGGSATSEYVVKTLCRGKQVEHSTAVSSWEQPFLRIHLNRPADGVTPPFRAVNRGRIEERPEGEHYSYEPNDCSVGDLDGDGRSEVACKTAPGTVDGTGKYVLLDGDDPLADYRTPVGDEVVGTIMEGPEYLTVFDGETGAEVTTIPYVPGRDITNDWGDRKANRSERYLACVAYLDGEKPSLVMCRGYYMQAYIAAFDFDGRELKLRWLHRSEKKGEGLYGEGAHSLAVADVDHDGCDEVIYGSAVLDHDGTVLHRTGLGHGDALHVSDLIPDREGLEIFMVHEDIGGADVRDAATGEILYREEDNEDTGRGIAADIDPGHRGFEFCSKASPRIYSTAGFESIARGRIPLNFRIYWDGDLYDELLDGTRVSKWNPQRKRCEEMVDFRDLQPVSSCNGSKKTPSLSADILGDWREEVILWDRETASDLVVFTTTLPTDYRIPTLMHDPLYRMSIVWQNVAYNQPPHLGFYLPDRYGR